MVNTRSAVPLVGQSTSETFQNLPSAQGIIEEALETSSEGLALRPSNKQSTTDQLDNINEDHSLYEVTLPPSSTGIGTTDEDKSMSNAGPAFPLAPGSFVGTIDKKIAALTAKKSGTKTAAVDPA